MIARRKYKQIYDDILRLIQNGTLKPGDRLPSEQTLAENYGVCRDTIRKALIALKDAGYSQSVRGGGTYIRFYDAYLAVQEFYRHNYDTVIHITDSVCERISVRNRKEGFMKGMQQFFPNSNIIVVDMAQPSGVSRLKNLLDNDVRIGFFLYDDLLYPRIRPLLLKSRKKLMRDIGVLGYNDLDICNEFPEKLSSIHLPRYELGKRSFELLDQHLNFNISMEVSHILLKSNIIFRGTF